MITDQNSLRRELRARFPRNHGQLLPALHFLQHAMFISAAVFFWWIAIDPVPLKPRLSYALRLLYLFLATLQSTALAAIITLSEDVLYSYYESVPRLWGLTPAEDQMIAGLIMWIPGAGIYFIVLSALFFVMLARDNERMRRLEGRPVRGPRRWGCSTTRGTEWRRTGATI